MSRHSQRGCILRLLVLLSFIGPALATPSATAQDKTAPKPPAPRDAKIVGSGRKDCKQYVALSWAPTARTKGFYIQLSQHPPEQKIVQYAIKYPRIGARQAIKRAFKVDAPGHYCFKIVAYDVYGRSAPADAGCTDVASIEDCQVLTEEEQQQILDAHNTERQNYPGIGALQWSPEIARWAQQWAEARANEGNINHRENTTDNPFRPGEYIGENIYRSTGPTTGANAVQSWISEKQWYHYELDDGMAGHSNQPPGCTAPQNKFCGHFTQVVWMATQYVGCGKATAANGNVYFVCNYYPAGNVAGQMPY